MCDDNEKTGEGQASARMNEKNALQSTKSKQQRRGEAIKPNIKKSLQHKVEFQSKRTNDEVDEEEEQTKCSKRSVCVRLLLDAEPRFAL